MASGNARLRTIKTTPPCGRSPTSPYSGALKNGVTILKTPEVNAKLEAAVAPINWRRRAKSLLTGRSLAEIILSETAGFQLERLLLIDRTSGVLLGNWTAREDDAEKIPGRR